MYIYFNSPILTFTRRQVKWVRCIIILHGMLLITANQACKREELHWNHIALRNVVSEFNLLPHVRFRSFTQESSWRHDFVFCALIFYFQQIRSFSRRHARCSWISSKFFRNSIKCVHSITVHAINVHLLICIDLHSQSWFDSHISGVSIVFNSKMSLGSSQACSIWDDVISIIQVSKIMRWMQYL